MIKDRTIYVDMDGVLANFAKLSHSILSQYPEYASGKMAVADKWKKLQLYPNMFLNLEPLDYAFDLWNAALSLGYPVEILTAIPHKSTVPLAEKHKREWIRKYFGEFVIVNIGPFASDKWKHGTVNDVLIDDTAKNINDWVSKCHGIGILHDSNKYLDTIFKIKSLS